MSFACRAKIAPPGVAPSRLARLAPPVARVPAPLPYRIGLVGLVGDGRHLIASTVDPDGSPGTTDTKVWDLDGLGASLKIHVRSDAWYFRVAASPDGRWLVTGTDERDTPDSPARIVLWDLAASGPLPAARLRFDARSAAFSSDGRWLLIGATIPDLTAGPPADSRVELPAIRPGGEWPTSAPASSATTIAGRS